MGKWFRRFLLIFILFFTLFSTNVFAKEVDIKVSSADVVSKSDTVQVETPVLDGNNINTNVTFNEQDDFVVYEVTIKNNDDEAWKINSVEDNYTKDNLKIDYEYDKELIKKGETSKVKITITYKKKLVNTESINISNLKISLNLISENGDTTAIVITNPNTNDGILKYLILLIITITGLIFIKNKKVKAGKLLVLVFIIMSSFTIFASEKYQMNINIKNLTLKSEYLDYEISFNTNGGNEIESRTITYGQEIGELPIGAKNGYKFNGWKDQNGNSITSTTKVKGPLQLTADFTAISYVIEYDLDNGTVSPANPTKYTIEDEITLNNPKRKGYTFDGWTGSNGNSLQTRVTISHETGDKSYIAHFSKNLRASYIVIHKYENLNGGYDEEIEELEGATDSIVKPAVKEKYGFDNPEEQEIKIEADGSSSVTYIYSRKMFSFNILDRTYIDSSSTPDGNYPYDTSITIKANERPGYSFKWSDQVTDSERTFGISSDINITPIYTAIDDTSYKVIHKQMNIDGITYTEVETENKVGTTDTEVTPEVKNYEGFTSPDTQTVNINGDGSTVVEYLYTRNKFNIIVNNSDKIVEGNLSGEYYYNDKITLTAKDIPGYTFEKWSNDIIEKSLTITVNDNITVEPIYTKNSNTKYKVIHKQMNMDGITYTEVETENKVGTTDTEVTPEVKNYEGFTSPDTQTVNINGDGSTVVEYLYTRDKYQITIENSQYIAQGDLSREYYYGEQLTLTAIDRDGYTFEKWSNGSTNKELSLTITETLTLSPSYVANNDTPYVVMHQIMNLDGTTYTTIKTENMTGTTGASITPDVKTYEGFTSPEPITTTIADDGSTIVEYKYIRNKYVLTLQNTEYIDDDVSGEYYYGEVVTVTAKNRDGYTFDKWSNDAVDQTISITILNNFTITPIYIADTTTPYKVVHKQMNMDGITYTEVETENKVGTTDTEVTPGVKTYEGFTSPDTQTVNINGDKSTVVEYLYSRNKYKLTVDHYEDVEEGNLTNEYYYGEQVTLTAKNKDGHTFLKWSNGESTKQITINVTGTLTIYPIYDVNTLTITFDPNGGSVTEEGRVIEEGSNIGELPVSSRDKYIFDGWYTGISDGVKINENTIPSGNVTYYARWKKSVALIEISKPEIQIKVGQEETINIINGETIEEDFEFISSNSDVATVDENGKVKGVSEGETVITIKGITSGEEKTISVVVSTNKYNITFDSQGGSSIANREITEGSNIGELPVSSRDKYIFDGWYTGITDGIKINENTIPLGNVTYYARWKKSIDFIEINNPEIQINVGEEETINILNKNDIEEEIVYISSDNNIATVDENGKVKGVAVGEVTITIKGVTSQKEKTVAVTITSQSFVVTFDSQGGSEISSIEVQKGEKVGTLPEPTKSENSFDGWYTNTNYTTRVTSATEINSNVTFYAKWVPNPFPIVFSQVGACTFNGQSANITGEDCKKYWNYKYIDTNVKLYSEENYAKDYEIYFEIDEYDPEAQDSGSKQNVFVNAKYENSSLKWPGIVFRRRENSTTETELTQTIQGTRASKTVSVSNLRSVRILRKNKYIYYSINGEELQELQSTSNFNQYFDVTTWFGAAPDENGTPMRYLNATLSNMYVKLGTMPDSEFIPNSYTVTFDPNGGTVSTQTKLVTENTKIGSLPTPSKTDYVFSGWYTGMTDGVKVDEATIITQDTTLYARWGKSIEFANLLNPGMSMYVGDSDDVFITNPEDIGEDVTYTSNNPSVASVDSNGVITANSVGRAVITLKGKQSNKVKLANIDVVKNDMIVTFDSNGGDDVAPIIVKEGEPIGKLPENPTKTNCVFEGWYKDSELTTKVSTSTIITQDTKLYAKWKIYVPLLRPDSRIYLQVGETYDLVFNNESELAESYSITSGNTSIVTVNNKKITAQAVGSSYVRLYGNTSKKYNYIYITVTDKKYTVSFDSDGGTPVADLSVTADSKISTLPTSSKRLYYFKGWYLDKNYENLLTTSTVINKNIKVYAKWEESKSCAGNVDNVKINTVMCDNNENLVTPDGTVCRRAKTLHVESCNSYSSSCSSIYGYINNQMTFGNCGTQGILSSGDAFTCDVNGDGQFDEMYERFYYVGDYFNSSKKSYEDDTAVFIYYTNTEKGLPCNTSESYYGNYNSYMNGSEVAAEDLPTNEQWPNVGLKNTKRLLLERDDDPSTLQYVYQYSNYLGKSARLLQIQEVNNSCNVPYRTTNESNTFGDDCKFFTENVRPSSGHSTNYYWLDSTTGYYMLGVWKMSYSSLFASNQMDSRTSAAARPVIEVPKSKVAYGSSGENYYYIRFNPNGGTVDKDFLAVKKGNTVGTEPIPTAPAGKLFSGWYTGLTDGIRIGSDYTLTGDVTVYARYQQLVDSTYTVSFNTNGGKPLEDKLVNKDSAVGKLPTPEKNNYIFDGWYTDSDLTTEVTKNTVVSGDTTYYAKWLKDVSLVEIDSITTNVSGSTDIIVKNPEELGESLTYTTNDSTVATVSSGSNSLYVYGRAEGNAKLIITGNKTKKYTVVDITVRPQLYTITFDTTGGTPEELSTKKVEKDAEIGILPFVEKEGYALKGWGVNSSTTSVISDTYKVTGNLKLYAVWVTTVEIADIVNPTINLNPGHSESIKIRNKLDIQETYSYESNNTSIATVDSEGNVVGVSDGNTKIVITGDISGKTKEVDVIVTNIPNKYAVNFDSQGGSQIDSIIVSENDTISDMPIPVKNHYRFVGWYTNTEYEQQVTSTTKITDNMTIYAKWTLVDFPIVFEQTGSCYFRGPDNNISGSNCTKYSNQKYIDTGVKLYSFENYLKDYEIYFEIASYSPSNQSSSESKQTFVNAKLEANNYPGVVFRRDGNLLELSSKIGSSQQKYTANYYNISKVKIIRENEKVYYIINGGTRTLLHDVKGYNQPFDLGVWFGAAPANEDGTQAQRFLYGELRNMYIRLGDYSDIKRNTITFNANGGSVSQSSLVLDEDTPLGSLPTPTRNGWIFEGWYTDKTFTQRVDVDTVPTKNTTYYAKWFRSISGATVPNVTVYLNETSQVIVSNPETVDETYTYRSNNESIATVDESGLVTGKQVGSTTISLTGDITGNRKTINVSVQYRKFTIKYDSQGGSTVSNMTVNKDLPFGQLPLSTRDGYILEGWYTDTNYTTQITSNTIATGAATLYAKWREIELCEGSSLSTQIHSSECADNKDIVAGDGIICKRAKFLHQETCPASNGACYYSGYYANGTKKTNVITYGKCGTKGTLTTGDAFTCDVNGDGEFDELLERFYYVGDYFNINSSSTSYDTDTASLIYYSPTNESGVCNISTSKYNNGSYNYSGIGDDLRALLPSDTIWNNVKLKYSERRERSSNGYLYVYNSSNTLPTISYKDFTSRVITTQEIAKYCNSGSLSTSSGSLESCNFLFENTRYARASTDTTIVSGIWTESPYHSSTNGVFYINTVNRSNSTASITSLYGVKPVIEVPKGAIDYGLETPYYTVSLNANGGTVTYNYKSVVSGNAIGYLPTPTKDDYTFVGWFTGLTDGIQIDNTFTPTSNITVYAGWESTVKNTITFDSQGGTEVESMQLANGRTIGTLPTPTKEGYRLLGWYDDLESDTAITTSYRPTEDTTLYAKWIKTYTVSFDSKGGSEVSSVVIDDGKTASSFDRPTKEGYLFLGWYEDENYENKIFYPYAPTSNITAYAMWYEKTGDVCSNNRSDSLMMNNQSICSNNLNVTVGDGIICKRAENLHIEKCTGTYCKNAGYSETGSKGTDFVAYGSCGTAGTLTPGDAFTCDVDGDGKFNEVTERFYYLSNYYNPNKRAYEADTVSLLYYNNVSNGITCNNDYYAYSGSGNYFGPTVGATKLPTLTQWSNVRLKNDSRQILNQLGGLVSKSYYLPVFDYSGYAARFPSYQELNNACNGRLGSEGGSEGALNNCAFIMENVSFTGYGTGYWTENPCSQDSSQAWALNTSKRYFGNSYTYRTEGIRPVIEIPKSAIEYGQETPYYKIVFDVNGGNKTTNYVAVQSGSQIGTLPKPTREYYKFVGWYTDINGGVKIDETYIPTSNITVYARWEESTLVTVTFDSNGGSSVESVEKEVDVEFGDLPISIKSGYVLEGWYTSDNYLTKVTNKTVLTSDTTFYAKWIEITDTCDDNETITKLHNVACENNLNITTSDGIICKRAETLHQEDCTYNTQAINSNYCEGAGYKTNGSKQTTVITYGNCGTSGTLTSGDAFTCDVNGDGEFNELNERFYYVSDYYNVNTSSFEDDTAVLIYYNNVSNGKVCNINSTSYNSRAYYDGPKTATIQLPTSKQWNTIELKNNVRQIQNISGTTAVSGYDLPRFNYNGNNTRLLTTQELKSACGITYVHNSNELKNCLYLLENTAFAKTGLNRGYWLETASTSNPHYADVIYPYTSSTTSVSQTTSTNYGVRPVIEIPKKYISYGQEISQKKVTYNPNGGTTPKNYEIYIGDTPIGTLPEPEKELAIFDGWYTGLLDGVKVDENYIPQGDITLYAKWIEIPYYTVTFETNDGTDVSSVRIKQNTEIGELPSTLKPGFVLDGWYSDSNYQNRVLPSTIVNRDITLYAKWIDSITCPNNADVTEIQNVSCPNNQNITIGDGIVCKRAEKLHQEECTQFSKNSYCSSQGFMDQRITYGSCGTSGTLATGDAFTCDVNSDGEFNEVTERFYYISDYYNTDTNEFENDTAVLVYYNNISNGLACNTSTVAYSTNTNEGPTTASKQLPLQTLWTNMLLKNNNRQMLTPLGEKISGETNLPTFNYSKYSSRLLTTQELVAGCNLGETGTNGELDVCKFLLENTIHTNAKLNSLYWLENFGSSVVNATDRKVTTSYSSNTYSVSVRPAIEVPKDAIEYGQTKTTRIIKFNSNGGKTQSNYVSISIGSPIGELPIPTTDEDKTFEGWYTGLTDGTKIDSTFIPAENITVYAHWN